MLLLPVPGRRQPPLLARTSTPPFSQGWRPRGSPNRPVRPRRLRRLTWTRRWRHPAHRSRRWLRRRTRKPRPRLRRRVPRHPRDRSLSRSRAGVAAGAAGRRTWRRWARWGRWWGSQRCVDDQGCSNPGWSGPSPRAGREGPSVRAPAEASLRPTLFHMAGVASEWGGAPTTTHLVRPLHRKQPPGAPAPAEGAVVNAGAVARTRAPGGLCR